MNSIARSRRLAATSVLVAIVSLSLVGCNGEARRNEHSKLELAEMKGDLDQMFISLQRLAELGNDAGPEKLSKVKEAIGARERMLKASSDHDHEAAVLAADKLVTLFPDNKDAVRVLRESGQIFWLLKNAQDALAKLKPQPALPDQDTPQVPAYLVDERGRSAWRVTAAKEGLRTLGYNLSRDDSFDEATRDALNAEVGDYHKGDPLTDGIVSKLFALVRANREEQRDDDLQQQMFAGLSRARDLVAKAHALDPQFKGSIDLDELLDHAQSAMVANAANHIYERGRFVVLLASTIHDALVNALQSAADSSVTTVTTMWTKISPIAASAQARYERDYLSHINRSAKTLASFKTGEALSLADEAQKFAILCANSVDRLLNPTGSLIDFRRAGVAVADDFAASKRTFEAAQTTKVDTDAVARAVDEMAGFNLFKDPQTRDVIDRNAGLYQS